MHLIKYMYKGHSTGLAETNIYVTLKLSSKELSWYSLWDSVHKVMQKSCAVGMHNVIQKKCIDIW